MWTSWSSVNQISNKFMGFFHVFFALSSLKYPNRNSLQTPRVSTELEMLVNLSQSFILLSLSKRYDKKVSIAQLKSCWSALKISKWRKTRRRRRMRRQNYFASWYSRHMFVDYVCNFSPCALLIGYCLILCDPYICFLKKKFNSRSKFSCMHGNRQWVQLFALCLTSFPSDWLLLCHVDLFYCFQSIFSEQTSET